MGETVDALVVGASSFLHPESRIASMILFKLETTDPESVGEAYRLLYARSLMIGTQRGQTKSQSTQSFFFFCYRWRSKFLPRYSTFVRIGSGLSYADYVWVRSLPWKEWSTKNPPEFLCTATGSRDDKGDLYLEPEEFGPIPGSIVAVLNCVAQFFYR
jgi:hypothetical protein